MAESAKPNRENSIILKSPPASSNVSGISSEVTDWLAEQINLLAKAFAEKLTDDRASLYIAGLADIPPERLRVAFQRSFRELVYFPKIAELRNLAGSSSADEAKIEADAAWTYVNEYLRKWGVDLLPIHSGGKQIAPPPLDTRVEYALRRIGGLQALNQMDMNRMPFMYRDFCEAYTQAPLAEQMAPRLEQQFGTNKVLGTIKGLAQAKTMLPERDPETGKQ